MEQNEEKNNISNDTPVAEASVSTDPKASKGNDFRSGSRGGDRRSKNQRSPRRTPRAKPEFDNEIINIRRVTRVVAGGKRFNFSVALVAGNRRGMVGVGLGKAGDTPLAIEKALRDAKNNMLKINATRNMSIPHGVKAKYSSARIMISPAKDKGIIAGSAVRTVLELAGLKDINGKIISPSKNKLNIARATVKALSLLKEPREPKSK